MRMTGTETSSRDSSHTPFETSSAVADDALSSPARRLPLPSRRDLVVFAAVFALAFGARLAFLAWDGTRLEPDSHEYFMLAKNLREHGVYSLSVTPPYEPSIRRPPIYPVFLGAFGWTSVSSSAAVAVVQCALDATTAAILLGLARMVVSRRLALAAAVVYAVHPGPISYASTMISEPLFTLLLTGAVLVLAHGLNRGAEGLTAFGFAGVGLASLCRGIALPLPFVFAGLLLATKRLRVRRSHVWLLVAAALLVIVPWCVRSSVLAGRFVPVHSGSAVNLYEPTRVTADGVPDSFYAQRESAQTPAEQAAADSYGLERTIENITSDPGRYLRQRASVYPYLFLTSFDRFTGIEATYGELYTRRAYLPIMLKIALLVLFAAVPLALAVVGLRRATSNPVALLCAGVWCYTLLIHIPLWIEYRFWLPALPALFVSAAAGVEDIRRLLLPSRRGE
jgi:4-amino-4-deoxy-L-arabinose transferase-like glycosyltransferase